MRYFVSYAAQKGNDVPRFGNCEVVRDHPFRAGEILKLQDKISEDLANRGVLGSPSPF